MSAGAVARRLGVAVTTVRTWDRRYGLGPARRQPGRHRRYDEQDMARLTLMRRLTNDGVRAAEAARLVLAQGLDPGPDRGPSALPDRDYLAESRGLWHAALALDGAEIDRIVRRAIASGVVDAWDRVLSPAMRHVERRHYATGRFVESEHLLTFTVSAALAGVPRPATPARILLACCPTEQHTLALEALAAALAEQGKATRMLGARVPAVALRDAIARTGPAAVVLWAQSPEMADRPMLELACDARPRPALVMAAGPGWADTPPYVATPPDLGGAVALLSLVP